jgi:hypothetical protein
MKKGLKFKLIKFISIPGITHLTSHKGGTCTYQVGLGDEKAVIRAQIKEIEKAELNF